MSTSTSELSPADLDAVFMALANRTRREMLDQLRSGPATVSELAAPYAMSLPGASKHVRVLERAGLVHREIEGRIHRCNLEPQPLGQANEWLEHHRRFWEQQLTSLAEHFKATNEPPTDQR